MEPTSSMDPRRSKKGTLYLSARRKKNRNLESYNRARAAGRRKEINDQLTNEPSNIAPLNSTPGKMKRRLQREAKKETIAKRTAGREGLRSRIEEEEEEEEESSSSTESDGSLALIEIGKNSNKRKVNKTLPLKTESSKAKSETPKMVRKKVSKAFPQETRETIQIISATSKSKVKTNLNLSQKSIGINKQPNILIEGNSLNSKFDAEKQKNRNGGKENEPVSVGNKSNKSKSKAPKTVKAKVD